MRRQVAQHIGVVFGQKTQLWWDIPLIESFKVLKEIYQVSDADYRERMGFLGEVLDITRFLSQPVRTLSLGERMRADLAASMLHNPQILFLDEPTIGMDVLVKEKIRLAIHALTALLSFFGFIPVSGLRLPFLTGCLPDLCAEGFLAGMLCGISGRNDADLAEDAHLAMLAK